MSPVPFRGRSLVVTAVVLVPLLASCSVPQSMRVRTGQYPVHQDEDVRFRTTYYFRVFDACEAPERGAGSGADEVFGGKPRGPYQLKTDSLYRFRMTGKGYSLFQRIHFESGTLRKEEIDPFGSAVVFDGKTNRFVYKSREDTQEESRRRNVVDEIERLRQLRDLLPKDDVEARQTLNDVVLRHLRTLAPAPPAMREAPTVADAFGAAADSAARVVAGGRSVRQRWEAAERALKIVVADTALLTEAGVKEFEDKAGTVEATLRTAAQKGHEAAAKAARAAEVLRHNADASDATNTYATAAREFAVAARAAEGAVTGAAEEARKLRDALRGVLPATIEAVRAAGTAGPDASRRKPDADAAEQAIASLRATLEDRTEEWLRLTERAGSLRDASAQIAATMTRGQPPGGRGPAAGAAHPDRLLCQDGTAARRGFQILGPEGWRTFDQDERLLLAMSSSAKPLVSSLQEVSRNILNAQANPAELLLPLVREQLRIAETHRRAERLAAGTTLSIDAVIDEILAVLTAPEQGAGQ